jgi:cytochrome P450
VALDLSDPASINTSSLEFWERSEEERDEAFAVLRRDAPAMAMPPLEPELAVIAQENPTGYRAIVRHSDIKAISRDAKTYSSAAGVLADDAPLEIREATLSFISMDAPRHTKLRGLVSSAFTPRQIARIEEGIRRHAKTIVAEAAPTGGGDFVKLIAKRLPLQTISDMIGVPEADRERIVNAADAIVSVGDESFTAGRDPMQVLGEAIWTLSQFATEMAEHREKNPGDDLMTALVQAEIDGDRLTHAEISAWFVLLSVAGNDTTRHTTSHAMRTLTVSPDQRALLLEDLDGRLGAAVEEFIRWASPVMTFRRTTTRPVELHGEHLPAGEKVVLFYHSANRDERAFEDPWRFDVTRDPNRHLGFGGGGPHYCLGASLARAQLRSIFGELLRLIPDIQAGEPELLRSAFVHGVKRMDCEVRARP